METLTRTLTFDRAHELMIYEPDTGLLKSRRHFTKWPAGRVLGTPKDGYVKLTIDFIQYRAHRVIWLMQTGVMPDFVVDHINGIRSDNRWSNLRDGSGGVNGQNMVTPSHNSSGLMGVQRSGRKNQPWYASISVNGRTVSCGRHTTKEAAHEAYLEARAKYFPAQPVPRELMAFGDCASHLVKPIIAQVKRVRVG